MLVLSSTITPDYFLPNRGQWTARVDEAVRDQVYELDRALTLSWMSGLAAQVMVRHNDSIGRIGRCIDIIAEIVVNQLASHAHLTSGVSEYGDLELQGDRIAAQLGYAGVLRNHCVSGVTAEVCRIFAERAVTGTILARL